MEKWKDEVFRTKASGILIVIGFLFSYVLKNELIASVLYILAWLVAGADVMKEAAEDLFHGHAMDTSALTGESLPREVKEGDVVLSGFINGGGKLTLRVEKTAENSSAARLIRLYKEASEKKAKYVS